MAFLSSTSRSSKYSTGLALVGGTSTQPSIAPHAIPEGTVTLMFGGLEDLTEMTERLGDQAAFDALKAYQSIVRAEIRRHGGFEVEFQGDEFLAAFSAANRGLRCAIAIARSLASRGAGADTRPLAARIGIHVGEPIKEGNRFFGKPVIVASRIAAHASGGEIFVSSLVADLLAGNPDLVFDEGRVVELKGLIGTQRIHRVLWDSTAKDSPQRVAPVAPRHEPAKAEPASESGNRFRLDGDFWTIAYAGRTVRIRDVKGVRYIAAAARRCNGLP